MLPHCHFLIAGLVIVPVGFVLFHEKSIVEIVQWVLIGGFLSSAVDLDVSIVTILRSKRDDRLKQFSNPREIFRKFDIFMDRITETGVLRAGLKIHLLSSIFIILIFYFFLHDYFVPVVLGIVSHLISDIPNLRRVLK
jgi:hypothetical protein